MRSTGLQGGVSDEQQNWRRGWSYGGYPNNNALPNLIVFAAANKAEQVEVNYAQTRPRYLSAYVGAELGLPGKCALGTISPFNE